MGRSIQELVEMVEPRSDALANLDLDEQVHLLSVGTCDTRVLKWRAKFFHHLAMTRTDLHVGSVLCWVTRLAEDLESLASAHPSTYTD